MTSDLVHFTTSGSTGTPVVWERTLDQLRLEGELMAKALQSRPDAVLTFADPAHLYGRIFGMEVPRILGVPTTQVESVLGPVVLPDAEHLLVVACPSTWKVLTSRMWARAGARLTIVHGAGPMPTSVDRVLDGFDVPPETTEVFGSTECGGVALRRVQAGVAPGPWRLVDDVDMLEPESGYGRLRVASQRIAHRVGQSPRADFLTEDLVERLDDRSFRHTGRRDRTLKIDGRRCDLEQVESMLGAALGADVACVPRPDDLRSWTYDVIVEGVVGDPTWVRGLVPVQPRSVELRETLPRTSRGKIDYAELAR